MCALFAANRLAHLHLQLQLHLHLHVHLRLHVEQLARTDCPPGPRCEEFKRVDRAA